MNPTITLARHHSKTVAWQADQWPSPSIVEWVDRDGHTVQSTPTILSQDGKSVAAQLSPEDIEHLADAWVRSACLTDEATRRRYCIQPVSFEEH